MYCCGFLNTVTTIGAASATDIESIGPSMGSVRVGVPDASGGKLYIKIEEVFKVEGEANGCVRHSNLV